MGAFHRYRRSYLKLSSYDIGVSSGGLIYNIIIAFQGSYEEWRFLWYLFSAILLMYGSVFLVLGQAKLQPWASPDSKDATQTDQLLKT